MTSSSSSSSTPTAAPDISKFKLGKQNKSSDESKPTSPYTISLYQRSSNPYSDVHNQDPQELPSHHVPTLASNVKRTALSSTPIGKKQKAIQKKDQVTQKIGSKLSSNQLAHPTASQQLNQKAQSILPLLNFQNPWPSFKAPGLWDMLHGGLQWGLPEDYFEGGGKGKYKGGGKHYLEKLETELKEAEKDGLRKGWEKVEIRKPDWGIEEPQEGDDDVKEWKSSNSEGDFVKATWLGHATTLLQLPSISPEDQALKESIEKEEEVESDKEKETGGKGKREKLKENREVEDVRKRSVNVLFDPIFSERCSPSQVAGPIRFTPSPCQVEDLLPIDIVLISHNHYDHLDFDTMTQLLKIRGPALKVFVPLGNKTWFTNSGFEDSQVIEMDWWDEAILSIPSPETSTLDRKKDEEEKDKKIGSGVMEKGNRIRIVCTPAQHGSGRGAGDKMASLWSSWLVEHITPLSSSDTSTQKESTSNVPAQNGDSDFSATESAFPEEDRAAIESLEKESPELFQRNSERRFRAFFAGDSGLKYHNTNIKKREQFPACPAFEEITSKFGAPQLLFLPISVGSSLSWARSWDPFPRRYSPFPRVSSALTSAIHMDPDDAVEVAGIMRGKGMSRDEVDKEGQTCLAVHYGTFIRNESQTAEDLRSLRKACVRAGMHFVRSDSGQIDSKNNRERSRTISSNRPGTSNSASAFGVGAGSKNVEREPSPTSGWNKTKHENRATVKALENEKGRKGRFVVSDQGETVWIRM